MRAGRTRALGCALLLGSFTGPAFALDDGAIVVVERDGTAPGAPGALFIVDRATGLRTLLSDFGNGGQGPLGNDPIGAIAPDLLSLLVRLSRHCPKLSETEQERHLEAVGMT